MLKFSDLIDPDIPESEIVAIKLLCKFCRREGIRENKLRSVLNRIFEEDIETSAKTVDYYIDYFNNLSIEDLLKDNLGEPFTEDFIRMFQEIIHDEFDVYRHEFKDNEFIILDFEDKTVKYKKDKGSRKYRRFAYSPIINAVPKRYNRNRDVFMDKYTRIITWESRLEKYPFTTNDEISEIKKVLENKNYIIQSRLLDTALRSIMIIMHEQGLFEDSEDIETTSSN